MSDQYCNNCGKLGHLYHHCKVPITSIGVIAFRNNPVTEKTEYLMIRRKDTLGHIDFMRGKYTVYNRHYIVNMLNQMTFQEKERIKTENFDALWKTLWGDTIISNQYKNEEIVSREKYNLLVKGVVNNNDFYTIHDLIKESDASGHTWDEAEWGFPKGRRNPQEKDFECALREFAEETGYSTKLLKNVQNILPYEEIFTGSNYKSYKHKYYIMFMNYENTLDMGEFEKTEVSKMEWKSYDECIECIRGYNIEKKRLITKIDRLLKTCVCCFV